MVFSSPVFLFLFLPACLASAFISGALDKKFGGHRIQNAVLLVFSLGFYLYGSGWHIAIMLGSIFVSWLAGLVIGLTRYRRTGLVLGIAIQVAVLGYYKYANFFVDQVSFVMKALGTTPPKWAPVLLPIGISFFVFQGISYIIDVYRRACAPRRSFLAMALFKALFPQLIAGPIVRYTQVASQLDDRTATLDDIAGGAMRFVYGLCKKLLIAQSVGDVADAAFALKDVELSTGSAWIGALAYAFQIYFDFSAYSDMAIGLGRMFGFRFPENFRRPYSSISITDFWRRWHMTLSFWFRDYVYVSLGGSRVEGWKVYRNLWIVFLLSGLWHGASWTFVAWGAYHGALLTIERLLRRDRTKDVVGAKRFASVALTFVLVVIGFTLFRSTSFPQFLSFVKNMVIPNAHPLALSVADQLTHKNLIAFIAAASSLWFPAEFVLGRFIGEASGPRVIVARYAFATAGLVLSAGIIASDHFSPFIYFRF